MFYVTLKILITWLNTVNNHSTRDSSKLKLSLGFKNKIIFPLIKPLCNTLSVATNLCWCDCCHWCWGIWKAITLRQTVNAVALDWIFNWVLLILPNLWICYYYFFFYINRVVPSPQALNKSLFQLQPLLDPEYWFVFSWTIYSRPLEGLWP